MEEADRHPSGQLSCGIKVAFALPDGITTVQEFGLSPTHDNANTNNGNNYSVTEVSLLSKVNQSLNNNLHDDGNDDHDHDHDDRNVIVASSQVAYTGRHDHGPLPPPRHQKGPYATLIDNVRVAQEFSNTFLTGIMKQETVCRQQHMKEHRTELDTPMETASKKHKPN